MGEPQTYFLETLGCPKNQVDSDKLEGRFAADGMTPVDSPDEADIVVVNTCAFIDEARQESVDTILSLSDQRREGAKLVTSVRDKSKVDAFARELAQMVGTDPEEARSEVRRAAARGPQKSGRPERRDSVSTTGAGGAGEEPAPARRARTASDVAHSSRPPRIHC